MKSIDKLREFVADINECELDSQIVWTHNDDGFDEPHIKPGFVDGWHRAVDKVVDDLEREIAANYMELPLDADGVPIRVGDMMVDHETPREVVAITSDSIVMTGYPYTGEQLHRFGIASNYKHRYHAPTVEDVLEEFAHEWNDTHFDDFPALKTKYADRLREVLANE